MADREGFEPSRVGERRNLEEENALQSLINQDLHEPLCVMGEICSDTNVVHAHSLEPNGKPFLGFIFALGIVVGLLRLAL